MSDDPVTVRDLWAMARMMLGTDDVDSRQIRSCVLILATSQVGVNLKRLHDFTGIPQSDLLRTSYYLRKAGIWGMREWYAPWLDDGEPEDRAQIAIVLHTMVATGEIQALDKDEFACRTLRSELGIDSDVPWGDVIPSKPLHRNRFEIVHGVPWWVRRRDTPRAA